MRPGVPKVRGMRSCKRTLAVVGESVIVAVQDAVYIVVAKIAKTFSATFHEEADDTCDEISDKANPENNFAGN